MDYGKDQDYPRSPEIQAQLLSVAILAFPDDPKTRQLLNQGAKIDNDPVRFLALCASRKAE